MKQTPWEKAVEIREQIGKTKRVFAWFSADRKLHTMIVDKKAANRIDNSVPGYVGIYDRFSRTQDIEDDIVRAALLRFNDGA